VLKKVFQAMASPCEVLVDTYDGAVADDVGRAVQAEAARIESKYSRYRQDNIVHQINSSRGKPVLLDEETAHLIDFAFQCFKLSDGLFDITSGILRRIWNFSKFETFPSQEDINACLDVIGLDKVKWNRPYLQLKKGMEIDFGGIAKEYAVDKGLAVAAARTKAAVLVNFGGDLAVNQAPKTGSWRVAIEEAFKNQISGSQLALRGGALATSGDTRRFFEYEGRRYSHILNPKTGLPVSNDIASITVYSSTCTMAGVLSTLSHLQDDPEAFLKSQDVPYWLVRHEH
jgi:thiamine biosynthesis lipoprotein